MVRTIRHGLNLIRSDSQQQIMEGYVLLLRRILRGDAAALDALGSMLTYGVGIEPDLRLAAACYTAASRASHTGATYNLAAALIEGAGVPRDVRKGLRLLRAAVRGGEASAMNYLGFLHRVGEGVTKDPRRGFALSLKAAKAGVAAAQYDVALCLLSGTGVDKDLVAAQRWISRAARGGDRDAREYLDRKRRKRRPATHHQIKRR